MTDVLEQLQAVMKENSNAIKMGAYAFVAILVLFVILLLLGVIK